jgi:hypothetical protein
MNCEGYGVKPSWTNMNYYNRICEERLRKNKNSQGSRFSCLDSKLIPSEYNSGALPLEPKCSVFRDRECVECYIRSNDICFEMFTENLYLY